MKREADIPNPGSDEAIESGCTCPVLDNSHGRGFGWPGSEQFWISEDCPLHGVEDRDKKFKEQLNEGMY